MALFLATLYNQPEGLSGILLNPHVFMACNKRILNNILGRF